MATPSKQIGWGAEENLLSFISKQLGYLTNVAYNSGSNSSTGPQGPQGIQGIQGVQGTQGLIGIQGETGATGPTGAQGVQGDQGLLGPVGPAGLNWQGVWTSETSYVEDDAVGYNGASWFCILPTSGTTTPDLDTTNWALLASQGAQGQAGLNGVVGATGSTGAQGTIGLTGPEGPQGVQGAQGEQGIQGIKGVKGDKGDQGIQGNQGDQGIQGVQGPSGVDGAVGPAGLEWQGAWVSETSYVADDAVGYDGASWFCILPTSGTTPPDLDTTHWALLASQGAHGAQGIQGIQGLTGAQGPAGSLVPITASAPLTGGTITTTGTIGINQATASVSGYLSSTDFTTFTNKANVNSQTFTGTPSLPIGTTGVTQAVGTNNTTLATTEFVTTAANNRLVVETTLGYGLTNADSGGIIIFKTTAAQTLTIPAGLADGFECTFVTLAGVTLTVSAGSNVLNNAISTLLAPQSSFKLKRMIAANTFIATGNL
jgi:hypothetical protein